MGARETLHYELLKNAEAGAGLAIGARNQLRPLVLRALLSAAGSSLTGGATKGLPAALPAAEKSAQFGVLDDSWRPLLPSMTGGIGSPKGDGFRRPWFDPGQHRQVKDVLRATGMNEDAVRNEIHRSHFATIAREAAEDGIRNRALRYAPPPRPPTVPPADRSGEQQESSDTASGTGWNPWLVGGAAGVGALGLYGLYRALARKKKPVEEKSVKEAEPTPLERFQSPGFAGTYQPDPYGGVSDAAAVLKRMLWGAGIVGGGAGARSLGGGPRDSHLREVGRGMLSGAGLGAGLAGGMRLGETLAGRDALVVPLALGLPAGLMGLGAGAQLAEKWLPVEEQKRKKQADFLTDVHAHLPRIRAFDTLAGAGLGAAGGALVEKLRKKPEERNYLKALLTGGAAGAVGGNLVGDRTRRYVSNKVLPFGYGDPLGQLKPRGVGDVWRAAIQDKPSYEPERMAQLQKEPGFEDVLGARRELFRRQLGVHTDRPESDVWARQADGAFSINQDRPGGLALLKRLMEGSKPPRTMRRWYEHAAAANRGEINNSLMGSIVGGQAVTALPAGPLADPTADTTFSVRDRWDQTLSPRERSFLWKGLGKKLTFQKDWLGQPVQAEGIDYAHAQHGPRSNRDVTHALLGRHLLDKVLAHENPWVTEHVRVRQLPGAPATSTLTGGAPSDSR